MAGFVELAILGLLILPIFGILEGPVRLDEPLDPLGNAAGNPSGVSSFMMLLGAQALVILLVASVYYRKRGIQK